MHDNPSPSFVRWPELLAEVPLGQNSIRDMISRGEFPAPVPLGPRTVGFVRDEIEAWKAERIAARGGQRNGR
ncbi:helix-turn-helix transcriptional regulator [Aquamicrobium terrae]|uniref:Prophage regulatory protein n=1 Tax=Aquamicrobium terrae TaxID=1324945 RepID=A0ABV2MVV6_9HYPH